MQLLKKGRWASIQFIVGMAIFFLPIATHAQFMVGGGLSYGEDIEQFAPNFRLYYFPNHKICLGPEFAYFPMTTQEGVEKQLTEYGFSGHYIFQLNERLGFYPLLGINYAIEQESFLNFEETERSFGANLGFGFHLEYGSIFPFAEYKYVASELSQNVLSIGVLVNLSSPKHEKEKQH